MAGVGYLPLTPGVTPSISPGERWRQESAWSYSGISAVVIIVVGGPFYADAVGVWMAGAQETQPFLAGAANSAPWIAGGAEAQPWLAGAEQAKPYIAGADEAQAAGD